MVLEKEDLFEGVQIPKESTRPLKTSVKKVVVEAKLSNEEMEAMEGTYGTEKDVDKIYDEDVDI